MNVLGNPDLNGDEIRECIETVLNNYEKPETQQQYVELLKLAVEECEDVLKNIDESDRVDVNDRVTKGVVLGRVKKYGSLKKKLEGLEEDCNNDPEHYEWLKEKLMEMEEDPNMVREEYDWLEGQLTEMRKGHNKVPKFRAWLSEGRNVYEHPEMGDLVGVRIGLYFPDDIVEVVKEIQRRFEVKHVFGTVTGGRDVSKGKNLNIYKHLDGQWHDGNDGQWENYGYKSWQMVVECKEPLAERLKLTSEETANVNIDPLRIEIQVGTVVTQAWAEVQHNIIYKTPNDIRVTPAMKRTIDAINGLAITTDIMLRELRQSLEAGRKKRRLQKMRVEREVRDLWASTETLPSDAHRHTRSGHLKRRASMVSPPGDGTIDGDKCVSERLIKRIKGMSQSGSKAPEVTDSGVYGER